MKNLDKIAHLALIIGLGVGLLGYWRTRFDSEKGFLVIALTSVFYVIWGFVYHNLKGDFKKKLIIEYLIIAGIAIVASYLVLVS